MRFDQPVGTQAERNAPQVWAGGWAAIIKYAQLYTVPTTGAQAYHPGVDLNHSSGDTGKPVYASADGVVTRILPATWVSIIIVEHTLNDGTKMWSRYAHGDPATIKVVQGARVSRGQHLVNIGDYYPAGTPNDHLHFDIAKINLTNDPANWPGANRNLVLQNYVDPQAWINSHREELMATGAFARAPYGRKYLIPWTGDARWPQYPPCTAAQHDALEVRRRTSGFTLGNSHDDAGLAVITQSGERGQEVVELWGWPQEARATYNSFYAQYYPHAKVEYHEWSELNPKPPEPQPPASHPAFENITRAQALTGMHTINWVEDARAAVDKGCRVITMLDNLSGAREIRNRGVVVIYRTWFNDPGWTPTDCFNRLGVDANDRLILVGQNECDAGRCPGDSAGLRERFTWDKEFAEICWQRAPKCFPAIGGFSVGTPPIDNPEVAKTFRETYAAFCNANYQKVGLNWHLYVWRRVTESWKPQGEEVHPDQRWWAGRAKFFGYDPAYGGLNANVISVSDEIGGECGHGGWNWAGYNDGDANQWWNYWRDYMGAFSQLKYATIFIGCRSESWRGYDVRYLWPGAFRSIWGQASTRTAPMSAETMQLDDYVSGYKDAIGRAMYDARMKQKRDE